ncbi:MAG: hypothetical protein FJY92_01675 [Candidatus Hydrogenedentes bacterium]|nr:hypothetical protein [Candidatus Hydrogenedentota bacterium]
MDLPQCTFRNEERCILVLVLVLVLVIVLALVLVIVIVIVIENSILRAKRPHSHDGKTEQAITITIRHEA